MEELLSASGLVVSQRKEWGEIVTGFETKNSYVVSDVSGQTLYNAFEEGGSTIVRWFLKALRPFTIRVLTESGSECLRVNRPFRFYFHEAAIYDSQQQFLGRIERQFSILRRKYLVKDSAGHEVFELFGPLLHPWTFQIKKGDREYGKIMKKWSGLMKEGFTDADNFGVTFLQDCDNNSKALLLGAVFLIDFVHFENTNNNG